MNIFNQIKRKIFETRSQKVIEFLFNNFQIGKKLMLIFNKNCAKYILSHNIFFADCVCRNLIVYHIKI